VQESDPTYLRSDAHPTVLFEAPPSAGQTAAKLLRLTDADELSRRRNSRG
jgi:hypothetical protein